MLPHRPADRKALLLMAYEGVDVCDWGEYGAYQAHFKAALSHGELDWSAVEAAYYAQRPP